MKKSRLKNEEGMIAVDFMFAFVLVLGMTFLVFAFCFSLAIAEVTQYITFAAARNFSAAHINGTYQTQMAKKKYGQLINDPVFKPLYQNGLFEVPSAEELTVGNFPNIYPQKDNRYLFWGVHLTLNVPLLDFRIPFYGSTMGNDEGGEGFSAEIGSYLGREPTFAECFNFTRDRWNRIRALSGTGAPYSQYTQDNASVVITDNGC